jgi:hypothetical protein
LKSAGISLGSDCAVWARQGADAMIDAISAALKALIRPPDYAKRRKRFFFKKEAKTFARLSPTSPRQPGKSFLVLFFQKRTLSPNLFR